MLKHFSSPNFSNFPSFPCVCASTPQWRKSVKSHEMEKSLKSFLHLLILIQTAEAKLEDCVAKPYAGASRFPFFGTKGLKPNPCVHILLAI